MWLHSYNPLDYLNDRLLQWVSIVVLSFCWYSLHQIEILSGLSASSNHPTVPGPVPSAISLLSRHREPSGGVKAGGPLLCLYVQSVDLCACFFAVPVCSRAACRCHNSRLSHACFLLYYNSVIRIDGRCRWFGYPVIFFFVF